MIVFPIKVDPIKKTKKPVVTAWQKLKESMDIDGYENHGVLITPGYFAIDNDWYKYPHLYKSAQDALDRLNIEADWEGAKYQTTIQGGDHYFFKSDVQFTNGVDVFKNTPGFDIRSVGGFIATGKGYTTYKDDPFADAPEWPHPGLFQTQTKNDDYNELLNTKITNPDNSPITIEQLDALMASILLHNPNAFDDNDSWMKAGSAIHLQFDGSQEAYDVFDKYCQKCKGYDAKENAYRWTTFNRDPSSRRYITFRSLVAMNPTGLVGEFDGMSNDELNALAQQCLVDFRATDDKDAQEQILAKVKRINAKAKEQPSEQSDLLYGPEFYKEHVFTNKGSYIDVNTMEELSVQSFNFKYKKFEGRDDKGRAIKPHTIAERAGIPVISKITYEPNEDKVFHDERKRTCLNTFVPFKDVSYLDGKEYTTNASTAFKKHLEFLVTNPREQEIIISYLAHNIQYPGVKIPWMVILQGIPGDGKSYFGHMMQFLIGENAYQLDSKTLESKFNGWATGHCMSFIEEIYLGGKKYTVMNAIKPMVTNEVIEIERKGKDPINVNNRTNYFATTNHLDAIPVDDEDRRYCVIFSKWQCVDEWMAFLEENPKALSDTYDQSKGRDVGKSDLARDELLHYLMNYPIPDWFNADRRAPLTDAKKYMIRDSLSPDAQAVSEAIERYGEQIWIGEFLNYTALNYLAKKEFANERDSLYDMLPQRRSVEHALRDLGFKRVGERVGLLNSERRRCKYYAKGSVKQINDVPKLPGNKWTLDILKF